MDENNKNEETRKLEKEKNDTSENINPQNVSENMDKSPPKEEIKNQENEINLKEDKKEKISILKDIDLISELKNKNFESIIKESNFCDFRTREDKPWKIGLVKNILEDSYIIEDIKGNKSIEIKKNDDNKISYFRRHSRPDNEENFYMKRESKESLQNRLDILEKITKTEENSIFKQNIWDIYYLLHSKVFLGLDAAMKVNLNKYSYYYGNTDEDNEGAEESVRIILCILLFLSKYYEFIAENIEDFIYYNNKIINTELEDLKVVNKKCAFFSFFQESCDLLSKIFANEKIYLYWYTTFEKELKEIIPYKALDEDDDYDNEEDEEKYDKDIPGYEEENQDKKEIKDEPKKDNVLKLKKICLNNAYKLVTTFTTEGIKVKAIFVAYFIDYFNALNGFSNFAKIIYSSKSMNINLFKDILDKLTCAKVLSNSYNKVLVEEKKKILEFFENLIENLDEKTFSNYKKDEISEAIKLMNVILFKNNPKINDNLNFLYESKNLILSKKLEQKINSLTSINSILKSIKTGKSKLTFQEFCENCRKYKILHILDDKNIHEEIIKRLPDIIYIIYQYNFGYEKSEENEEKIKSDKKLIFDVLFNKLLESEQNNEKLVKNIQNIICDFCQILNEEDKINVYNEIINYINKSIEKKGIPMKEHLSFIIDYSLKAIETKKEKEKNVEEKDKNKSLIDGSQSEGTKDEETNKIEVESEDKNKVNNDAYDEILINSEIEKNKYYGLNILINYLSEDAYAKFSMTNEQKIEIINTSITGIIKIMKACSDLTKILLLKNMCSKSSLAIKNSKDIIQYLALLDKLKSNKELNKTFCNIFEEHSLKEGFLSSLMNDMERYLSKLNSEEKIDINKEKNKVYEGLFMNELNIKLRLDLIFFLIQKDINEENLKNFHNKVINSCEKNIFASDILNQLLYNNLTNFSPEIIQFIYNIALSSALTEQKLNDFQYYIFITEIIKEINKIEKHFYFMNVKDLAVFNCQTEKDIKGIELLWEFLIRTNNDKIRNKVSEFLSNIFYGIKLTSKEKLELYWSDFISNIYSKLEQIIQNENSNNDNQDKSSDGASIQGIILLIKKIEDKFNNKGEIIKDITQIIKEIELIKDPKEDKYIKISYSGNLYKTDKILNYENKIYSKEYFYMFRYKLSLFFKIPMDLISIVIDDIKYNNKLKSREEFNGIKFDMYNDLENSYNAFCALEEKINKVMNNNIENPLILKVEVKKENDYSQYIKKSIKDYPKLMKLLKRKNSECLLDVWCLIKEDEIKINNDIIQIIKDILNNKYEDNIDNIFNFDETNIYYISYILFHLNSVINEYNQYNENFITDIFLKNKIWEKIMNIKIEVSNKPHLGEIYEKNNIINYLVNIFKIISTKNLDESIALNILNKIIKFYYQTINDCININLKKLSSTGEFKVDLVEDLYISITNNIKEIIVKNQLIYKIFLNILLSEEEKDKTIKEYFEFLFLEGLLKNRIYSLNLKLQSFLLAIIDEKFFNSQEKETMNKFYIYLLNYFFSSEKYEKFINCIKDIALNDDVDCHLNIDKYENNIELYYEILINLIDKIYPITTSFYSFGTYLRKILLYNIYNPIIKDVPNDISFHEIILGGNLKVMLNLLSKPKNFRDILNLKSDEEDKLKHYLFSEIILNKCNKKIFTKENINDYNSISISSSYTFEHAVNFFIFLVIQNIQNEKVENINYYFETITEFHKECYWKGVSILDWKLDYKDNIKSTPFVGLKNLGCTCYMNSLLQVFFNFIPFRESILKCPCKEEKKNSLYQIKKVFYSLKYLQVSYYTPSDFPVNFDDEILDIHQQMDVDEFFGNILDKIENRLKHTKNENLVKYFFQGTQNDILTFQEGCTHHRINVNHFYSIQLQVQNKKNIYESLDTLTEGELMNGDNCIFCPQCNKKIPAVKSQKFKTLPRVLIFVLKRFEFNYDTIKKVKINDYYEFPQVLDMGKYLYDKNKDNNSNDDMNKFILKSVVVHMGNTEQGHYYAFIRKEGDKWYQFNDTEVTPFDINFLEEETFGGDEVFNVDGNKKVSKKNRSAYLLFYEKKNQNDCEKFDNIDAINLVLDKLGINNEITNDINKDNNNEIKENNSKSINEINEIKENGNENIINDAKENGDANTKEIENGMVIKDKDKNKDAIEEFEMKDILENLNNEMFKYFLNRKLFSNEYQYFILELFLNILNHYYCYDLPVFLLHICRNNTNTDEMLREFQARGSNLNHYLNKGELILFSKKSNVQGKGKTDPKIILNIFKCFILYFFNVLIRSKEKEYIGGMVDLIKFLINDQLDCSDYLIEEFCNKNVIIEYLINCPSYEIKKLIVGILYCAMIKSVNGYELSKIKRQDKNKTNQSSINTKKLSKTQSQSLEEDEELARQISGMEGNATIINENPLAHDSIPKNVLKLIYNVLHLIRIMGYDHLNEQRFLYFIIYRFSLINQNTKDFLINKCRVFEFLCLLLTKSCAQRSYPIKDITNSMFIGMYTVTHNILGKNKKEDEGIMVDKGGAYRNENYIFMLYFNLLNYNFNDKRCKHVEDRGYSLDNPEFVKVLLNNIRTKQDAFCFSNFINERCQNNKNRVGIVMDALFEYLNRVDNNENVNYDYNNYTNFVDNDLNANPLASDPGMNPKYLLLIIKRFMINQNLKPEFTQKFIKQIFKVFDNNKYYYNYSIMIIDFVSEIFTMYFRKYIPTFQKEIYILMEWIKNNPISPKLYGIKDLTLYKYQSKQYSDDIDTNTLKEFEEKELKISQEKWDILASIYQNDPKNDIPYEKDLNLMDFKFIIGDVIYYDDEETIIEEALDEMIKIKINNKGNKQGNNKREIWVGTDSPKIKIKELKNGKMEYN